MPATLEAFLLDSSISDAASCFQDYNILLYVIYLLMLLSYILFNKEKRYKGNMKYAGIRKERRKRWSKTLMIANNMIAYYCYYNVSTFNIHDNCYYYIKHFKINLKGRLLSFLLKKVRNTKKGFGARISFNGIIILVSVRLPI